MASFNFAASILRMFSLLYISSDISMCLMLLLLQIKINPYLIYLNFSTFSITDIFLKQISFGVSRLI